MATRIEALGYLAAGAAHEINNPLTYVFANLELLAPLVSTLEAARAREAALLVADAQEGATRIHSIVKTLARVARAGETDQAAGTLDVRTAVERAVAMACLGQPEREVPISVDGPLPPVRAAETDVVHIVFHLMVNAVQIGGDQVAISIELRSAGNEVAVRVSDDGPGIHESDLPHVFEPFYTTRRPGAHLGLGLSLCWELARRNGGHLDAENRSEGGAAFTLWLPVAKTAHSDRTPERGAT
jgi:signal transduction histidine kinase